MQGLVQVVDPATATPPRTTQSDANTIGAQERQADIAAGQAARDAFKSTTTPLPNGSNQVSAADGISEAPPVNAALDPPSPGGATGTATMAFTGPTNLHVVLEMTNLPASATMANHIHIGQCSAPSTPPGAPNNIIVPLTDLHSDASGNATGTTDFTWDPNTMGPPVIPSNTPPK